MSIYSRYTQPMINGFDMIELPPGEGIDGPYGWIIEGATAVSVRNALQVYGYDDLMMTAAERSAALIAQEDWRRHLAVVVPLDAPNTVVGFASADLPLQDNPQLAELGVIVDPDYRRRGLGSHLLAWSENLALQAGRSILTTWLDIGPLREDDPLITTPEGGSIPATDPGWLFAHPRGWELEQVERVSRLPLPLDAGWLKQQRGQAARQAVGYRVETWVDDIPAQWRSGYASLMHTVTSDAPMGGLDYAAECWDEGRVARQLQESIDTDRCLIVTGAINQSTGELSAITLISCPNQRKEFAIQWETVVAAGDRGHRLGMLVKAVNHQRLASLRPETQRIYTWNATQNDHMLGINTALGYRPAGASAALQRKVAP